MTTTYSTHATPIGTVLLVADRTGALTACWLAGAEHAGVIDRSWERSDRHLAEVTAQLDAYFAGRLQTFSLDLSAHGSAFQRDVWQALLEIPFGETASYGEIAASVNRPGAARAVGAANGRNPISIIVPCHRVIGAGGSLVGYGGGLDRKRWLLDHERAVLSGQGRLIA
jgi:methylated-DNA-[protein]-cysteine S-methyltransferase